MVLHQRRQRVGKQLEISVFSFILYPKMLIFYFSDFVLSVDICFGYLVTLGEDKGQYSIHSALMFSKGCD